MSRPREGGVKAAVMQFFTVLLLSLGLSLTVFKALLPQQALWPAALLCALFSLALEGMALLPFKKKWILPTALLAALALWGALGGGPVHTAVQLVKASFLSLRGIPNAAAPYAAAARWTICLIFTLLSAALAWDDTLPLAVFSVVAILALIFIFSPQAQLLLYALPAAAGLLLMMAHGRLERLALLPLAALLALGAFFLTPQPQTVPQLEKLATQLRQLVEDYLLFNEFRTSFSLATEGYQPLDNRLGGPADPQKHQVMEVTANRTLLLRGKTYNEYNGLNWYDTLSARRYLYASPRFAALRDELFDLTRPAQPGSLQPDTAHVRLLNHGTTTLFAPTHTRTVQTEGQRMVLYYNSASELFITRDLEEGDSYTLTFLPFQGGSRAVADAVAACARESDPHYQEVAADYLKLPRHIQQEIFQIAQKAAGDAQTPYDQALNIMRYLRRNYKYNLQVKQPPEGVDFVAWFLIGEKEGYCTYFATAMTVLCRIAGIPARYVTGYIASPEKGVALVTGEQAHAWTEVYLNGFGWLALDATPRGDEGQNSDPDPSDDPAADGATPPPRSTPSPTPDASTPTPAPTAQPSDAPDDSSAPPQSTPTPEPQSANTPTPPPADPLIGRGDSFPWWIVLLLAAAIAGIAFRIWWMEPVRRAARKPEQGAEILFAAILALLERRGMKKMPQETLHEFAARAQERSSAGALPPLMPLADQLAAQVYGRHQADPTPFRITYQSLRAAAKPWTRLALALRRIPLRKSA